MQLFLLDLEQFLEQNEGLPKRELEKAGLLRLLADAFPQNTPVLRYTNKGKPYLDNCEKFISVSHSHKYLVLLINEQEETGVDIELVRDKVLNIRHKFLNEEESSFAGDDLQVLITLWAAKEALFKVDGSKELRFKEDIAIKPFTNPDNLVASIRRTNTTRTFKLVAEAIDNYILVYVLYEF